ncbi:probable G-protein coupled receptor CG31760 isoform X2 [Centruroides vittatus]|uniref:probable G-protein coupled receptor CG31760 isoform X2 n=1 Tax=Centruroides vittatus TaxID=120091 RepID=UPI003510497B
MEAPTGHPHRRLNIGSSLGSSGSNLPSEVCGMHKSFWITIAYLVYVGADGCLQCKYKPWPTRGDVQEAQRSKQDKWKEELLDEIDKVSNLKLCTSADQYHILEVELSTKMFETVRQKTELIARLLADYYPRTDQEMLKAFAEETVLSDKFLYASRIMWVGNGSLWKPHYYVTANRASGSSHRRVVSSQLYDTSFKEEPWLDKNSVPPHGKVKGHRVQHGKWTSTYFTCDVKKWLLSYTAFVTISRSKWRRASHQVAESVVGVVSVDVDVTNMDVNQCDRRWNEDNGHNRLGEIDIFLGSHKCDNDTSQCMFTPGQGWVRGAYKCKCRDGYYSATKKSVFNGTLVESAWKEKGTINSPSYDMLYVCKPCQAGCITCVDDSPCLSHYNWAFRISLLTISMICVLLTIVLACYIYRYRKLKVIKVASPIFLCITLLGCAIMYSEMAAIFPVLDVYSCIATKWTRNMGFCITYSALLLKTWRVSLTYRVKSAHKLKLTDKQLLQWLFPILLVMAIYLGTWTISSPPEAVYIVDWEGLKFKQCDFNWWDHSLAIGEFLFLLWGIRVCYNVRHAESFFNEAKHISWAIYNITIINIIMVMIHVVILPHAAPDIKYLFGFVRTQLSTTVTIILIFGPKFYRVIKGEGDTWDNRARARGVTASFSLNGVGLVHEETPDLYQENEELKEEIQKLAAQIEVMRIVHMEINNRHLKPKYGSFFSQSNSAQSPVVKSMYMKFESTDSPGSRISPAAELVSERV